MKAAVAVLLLTLALALPGRPAVAGDFALDQRPAVSIKGGAVHMSPYPQNRRAASVWASDACWRDCKAACTWAMDSCMGTHRGTHGADACRPGLDACDRACQRDCRDPRSGPLLGFMDW